MWWCHNTEGAVERVCKFLSFTYHWALYIRKWQDEMQQRRANDLWCFLVRDGKSDYTCMVMSLMWMNMTMVMTVIAINADHGSDCKISWYTTLLSFVLRQSELYHQYFIMYCIYIGKCIICHNVSLTSFMKTSIRVVSYMNYAHHARLLYFGLVLSYFVPDIWDYATCTVAILRCSSASDWSRLGVGVTKPIFSVPVFSRFFPNDQNSGYL